MGVQRWTVLAMLAHAFLAVAPPPNVTTNPRRTDPIEVNVVGLRRLLDALLVHPDTA